MSILGDKIKHFRKLKGWSQEALAHESSLAKDYISTIERGKHSNLRQDTYERLSKALGISILELIDTTDTDSRSQRPPGAIDAPDYTPNDIPVVGLAKAGRGGFFGDDGFPVSGQSSRKVHRPSDVKDPNAYAVLVDGDSMEPFIRKNHVLLCLTNIEPSTGDYVVVQLLDGQVMVKEYRHDGKMIVLKSINPLHDPIILMPKEVRAIHVVHSIIRKAL